MKYDSASHVSTVIILVLKIILTYRLQISTFFVNRYKGIEGLGTLLGILLEL